jgi:hypothetical protein
VWVGGGGSTQCSQTASHVVVISVSYNVCVWVCVPGLVVPLTFTNSGFTHAYACLTLGVLVFPSVCLHDPTHRYPPLVVSYEGGTDEFNVNINSSLDATVIVAGGLPPYTLSQPTLSRNLTFVTTYKVEGVSGTPYHHQHHHHHALTHLHTNSQSQSRTFVQSGVSDCQISLTFKGAHPTVVSVPRSLIHLRSQPHLVHTLP